MRVIVQKDLERAATGEARAARTALRASLDALVIVGSMGPGGCAKRSVPLIWVQRPADLVPAWFVCCNTVGLMAGPCSNRDRFDAVRRTLEAMP